MRIRNFMHKGLRGLYEDDSSKGIPAASADKLRKQLAFMEAMTDPDELKILPLWSAHLLSGTREGTWSLTVTRNWRLTFWIDREDMALCDLNLEDYH